MRAVSLTQPWATLVAIGAKRIETRSWSTPYRGQIAIHAAKGFPTWARELASGEPFRKALRTDDGGGMCYLPLGAVVATSELVDCVRVESAFMRAPLLERSGTADEEAFGDYSIGRWAWILRGVNRVDPPVPARGSLGLW